MSFAFERNFQRTYTTTLTADVGPTTSMTTRQALPQPTPIDANTIFLAKNGNDGNPGTLALPKLTLAGAVAALTVAKPTIHIFRNGFVGDLTFTSASDVTISIAVTSNIQVALGEYATLNFTGAARLLYLNGAHLSGLYINFGYIPLAQRGNIGMTTLGTVLTVRNCYITAIREVLSLGVATCDVKYSVIKGHYGIVSTRTSTVENSIFIGILDPEYQALTYTYNVYTALFTEGGGGVNRTYTINRVIVYGDYIGVSWDNSTNLIKPTYNITSSHLFNNGIYFDDAAGITNNYGVINLTNCLMAGSTYETEETGTLNYAVTVTNPLDIYTPPLYVNAKDGFNGVVSGFRLQWRGKTAANGEPFMINSPLIGAGVSGADITPWDETTVLASEGWDAAAVVLDWPADGWTITEEPVNPISANDVNGNPKTNYDAIRKRLELTWKGYQNNELIWKVIDLLHDKGSLKWYPKGVGTSIYENGTNGAFLNSDLSFSPTSAIALIPHHWKGWWITFNSNDYYIYDNDTTKFYLADKFGSGFPADSTYAFSIQFMLIKPSMEAISYNQQYFTEFLKGGTWTEKDTGETLAFEYQNAPFRFMETENIEENR